MLDMSLTYLSSQELSLGKLRGTAWYLNVLKASGKFSVIINLYNTDLHGLVLVWSSYFVISTTQFDTVQHNSV